MGHHIKRKTVVLLIAGLMGAGIMLNETTLQGVYADDTTELNTYAKEDNANVDDMPVSGNEQKPVEEKEQKQYTDEQTIERKNDGVSPAKNTVDKSETNDKQLQEGWVYENGNHKFYKNGIAYTGWHYMGMAEGEKIEHWSYFGTDGVLRTGWQEMGQGTSNPDGKNKKHFSYFGANGWLREGWVLFGKGTSEPDGNKAKHWSYFGNNGWLTTEWRYFTKEDGEKNEHYSYFGDNGWLRTGSHTIGGKNYIFDSYGWMTYPSIMQINVGSDQAIEKRVAAKVSSMTLEEKIAQMFIVEPAKLGGFSSLTTAGSGLKNAINNRPVGGFIYFKDNLENQSQTRSMLSATNDYSKSRIGLPAFLCVDEEGGIVARIANNPSFGIANVGSMKDIGRSGNNDRAYNAGSTIGSYLKNLGFSVNFAPVADVLTNSLNTDVNNRVFGTNASTVSNMAALVSNGMRSKNILSTYKHFPGNGSAAGNTHEGFVYSSRTLSQLSSADLVPFRRGAQDSVPFIMVGHTAFPQVTGNNLPSSLSYKVITDILRKDIGYNGIIVSDSLQMGAIIKKYSAGDAAINAVKAGVDMVLMPNNFSEAYNAVLKEVKQGGISKARIDESVTRIVRTKMQMK